MINSESNSHASQALHPVNHFGDLRFGRVGGKGAVDGSGWTLEVNWPEETRR